MRIRDTSELRRDDHAGPLSPRDRILRDIAEVEAEYAAGQIPFVAYVNHKRLLLRQL
ncbi:hypothetical protein GCM10022198_25720 [Klugiella xanthotipulae]|uniref:Uncharacterized protein n=1 Tax=Klugiella xanthotipulae TaxID=244735 RepID=A0A543I5Q6_9MICO|nr:hypothetical protein [Klugiella xanthotipulae]TQM65894.1 hypothetical protein FB466_0714 [Klugiella xanthotipulae]